jgi:hypothetical protein
MKFAVPIVITASLAVALVGVSRASSGAARRGAMLGAGASLGGRRPFPDDNAWNRDISRDPVDPASARLIRSIGSDETLHPCFGPGYETPYVVVPGDQRRVPVSFDWATESDKGPYPIPLNAPIQGGSDHHVLVIDRDNWKLYELYNAGRSGDGWHAACGAIFDLNSNELRPAGWTSADAAGLPIFPGLVRYEEACEQQEIRHALRFTVRRTRHAFVSPARHYAADSRDSSVPPMGMRVRLRADYDVSGFPQCVQVILRALKTYGMFVADHGANWYITGAPDPHWDEDALNTLHRVHGREFEVVKMPPPQDER